MLTGEIGATAGDDSFANGFRSHLAQPLDQIDRWTGRQGVTFLGQQLNDPNGLWLTEFWNRSLDARREPRLARRPGPGRRSGRT